MEKKLPDTVATLLTSEAVAHRPVPRGQEPLIRVGRHRVVVDGTERHGGAWTHPGPAVDDVQCGVPQEVIGLCENPIRPIAGLAVRNPGHARLQASADQPERVVDGRDVDAAGDVDPVMSNPSVCQRRSDQDTEARRLGAVQCVVAEVYVLPAGRIVQ